MEREQDTFVQAVAQVLSSYLAQTPMPVEEIPHLTDVIAESLARVGEHHRSPHPEGRPPGPGGATPEQIAASIQRDGLTSFEDGLKYKSLKGHLAARGMTPDDYRRKWGLPDDYPMVAQSLREVRSNIARRHRGGRDGRPAQGFHP